MNDFHFKSESNIDNYNYLTGIIDSGTTCLILPSRFGTRKIYKGEFNIKLNI